MLHWANLEEREPTVKIVCRNYAEKPVPGLHQWDCPNLLWELRRARRQELSAMQLINRNPTERIVDKDNHLRDALKYMVLSLPEPAKPTALAQLQASLTQNPLADRNYQPRVLCDGDKLAGTD